MFTDATAIEEAHLDTLVGKFHTLGLPGQQYSRMLYLARRAARRHGVPVGDVIGVAA